MKITTIEIYTPEHKVTRYTAPEDISHLGALILNDIDNIKSGHPIHHGIVYGNTVVYYMDREGYYLRGVIVEIYVKDDLDNKISLPLSSDYINDIGSTVCSRGVTYYIECLGDSLIDYLINNHILNGHITHNWKLEVKSITKKGGIIQKFLKYILP